MPVEDAGEPHASKGDARFEGEAEGEREHVAVVAGAGAVDGAGEAVVRVEEDGEGFFRERRPDGFEEGVVEAAVGEAGGAEDDAADVWVGGGREAVDFGDDVGGRGGEREGGEGEESVSEFWRAADGFEFVVDGSRPGDAVVRAEEVEPGVREREDGGGDAVRVHEVELLVDG